MGARRHHYVSDIPIILHEHFDSTTISEDQCDCACSTTSLSTQPIKHSEDVPYVTTPDYFIFPLSTSFVVASAPQVKPVVLNMSTLTIIDYFQKPHLRAEAYAQWGEMWGLALDNVLDQLIELGLLEPVEHCLQPFQKEVESLSAWMHLTERCNLQCTYCYLSKTHNEMLLSTGHAVIDSVFRSAQRQGYKHIKLKYAGGEPLLCFPKLVAIHNYAKAKATKEGVTLEGIILSNGTLLTPEIAKTIHQLGLQLMISLDGLGQFHDRQRPRVGGGKSSIAVLDAIDLAYAVGLTPNISITVSGQNVSGLPEMIKWVLKRDLPFSLNFYRENECSRSHTELALEEEQIILGLRAAFEIIETYMPRRSLLAALVDRANLAIPHQQPCAVGATYLVFDSRGHVAKCPMQIKHIVASSDSADPLALVQADQNGIQNLTVDSKEGCRECRWRYWCSGGCPLVTRQHSGRYDVQSPNCRIYKSLFPDVVRLEGLRLLKWASC